MAQRSTAGELCLVEHDLRLPSGALVLQCQASGVALQKGHAHIVVKPMAKNGSQWLLFLVSSLDHRDEAGGEGREDSEDCSA